MKVHSPEWFDQQILAAQKRVSEWPEWMKQVAVPSRPTTDAEPPQPYQRAPHHAARRETTNKHLTGNTWAIKSSRHRQSR